MARLQKSKKNPQRKKKSKRKLRPFDKYALYERSVQSPENDVHFFNKIYKENRKKKPEVLREDFCGTFNVCCEWVKLDSNYKAIGLDLDLEPIQYGMNTHFVKLMPHEQSRLRVMQKNVLDDNIPRSDLIVALNFSYYIFKTRPLMKRYLLNCLKGLKHDGILILDCFGGGLCHRPTTDRIRLPGFSYFWEQASFNPIDHNAQFYIHFKRNGERSRKQIFQYDWRMWIIPELRDILEEVGFKETVVYWEGTTRSGGGDGEFVKSEVGDPALSWIAYIVALK